MLRLTSVVVLKLLNGAIMKCAVAMKKLKKNGWVLDRIKGSHHHFRHPKIKGLVTVPFHGSSDLSMNVIKSIVKMSGLSF